MSDLVNNLMKERIKFVIPNAGKLKYTSIGKNDKALIYTIDKGYLETTSMYACYYLSLFLVNTEHNKFIEVGNIERVKLKSGTIVYRQRFYFTDLSLLIRIIGHFGGKIVVPNSFTIGIQQMTCCLDSIVNLEKYLSDKGIQDYTIDNWLTDCCLLQIYMLSMLDDIHISIYKEINSIIHNGLLVRAPYLSGVLEDNKTSIMVLPALSYLIERKDGIIIDLLADDNYTYYTKLDKSNTSIPIYGYTTQNVKLDKE